VPHWVAPAARAARVALEARPVAAAGRVLAVNPDGIFAAAQPRVAVAVQRVDDEPDDHPDPEAPPGRLLELVIR
jgi:hypothetical protein